MNRNSRMSGFYKLSMHERRERVSKSTSLSVKDIDEALVNGGMDSLLADKTVENVIGTYALPLALGLNVQMNGRDYLAPMVVEEPSVIAAASNAAKITRAGGGFIADSDPPWMISQVMLDGIVDTAEAQARVIEAKEELLERANLAVPGLVMRGGGARDIKVRLLGDDMMAVHLLIDCRDAMGANLVNTVAEAVAPRIAELTKGEVGLRILSNLADERCVRVQCTIPVDALAFGNYSGEAVRNGIVRASRFAEADPYRAATHNKGIMNGVDAVVIATGNDWRSVEAGAHAFAAREGSYKPLCVWKKTSRGELFGRLEMPMALGIVGGPSRVHRGAKLALKLSQVESAQELGMLAACVGVASNFAALRALATDGIQEGHMALHARSVAIAAGASGDLVERVAEEIHAAGDVTLKAAERALAKLRTPRTPIAQDIASVA